MGEDLKHSVRTVITLGERLVLFSLFLGLWLLVQYPILNALIFREKYGLVALPLSIAIVSYVRYRKGGMSEVRRELREVATDLTFPFWYLPYTFQSLDTVDTSKWTQDLLIRLATLSKYVMMYGPFSFGSIIMMIAPIALLLQPMLYQDWFPALKWVAILYGCMMFCGIVTNACMHRFFSHASFKSSRPVTFALGFLGCLGGQFGPLWWASNHRRHHKYCETELDVHCPAIQGFWYSHCGWIMDRDNFRIRPEYLPKVGRDWPELLILDVFASNIQFAGFFYVSRLLKQLIVLPEQSMEPGFLFAQIVFGPEDGYVLGVEDIFFVDTALILGYALFLHFEFFINSLCHAWELEEKSSTDKTTCTGLDIYWVGLLNAGEGFHANHHQFPAEALHGPKWYYDWSYTFIAALEKTGLVWDVVRPANKQKVT